MSSSILLNPRLPFPADRNRAEVASLPCPDNEPSLPRETHAEIITCAINRPGPGFAASLLWALLFVAVTQLIPLCGLVVWSLDTAGNLVISSAGFLPALLVGQLLGVCMSVLALRVRLGRSWPSTLQFRRPALVPCFLAVLCLPALIVVGYSVETGIEHLLGAKEPTAELINEGMAHYSLWFCLLVIAVGAAVNEELFCRGFLGQGLVGRYGILLGVLLTSSIFGAIHLNLPQGVWACILGCFLHLTYLATRSLWVPVLLHFLNNAAAVLVLAAYPDFEPTLWQVVLFALPAYAIAIPAAWALYRRREQQQGAAQVA